MPIPVPRVRAALEEHADLTAAEVACARPQGRPVWWLYLEILLMALSVVLQYRFRRSLVSSKLLARWLTPFLILERLLLGTKVQIMAIYFNV